jgi:hypothetical protein
VSLTLPVLNCVQDLTRAHIEQWVDWANNFDDPSTAVVYPTLGYTSRSESLYGRHGS